MALVLRFPPECALTTHEIVTMISAVFDSTPTRALLGLTGEQWKWGDVYLIDAEHTGRFLRLEWGKLCDLYQPALSWGAIEERNPI